MDISSTKEATKRLKEWNKDTEDYLKKRKHESKKSLEEWNEDVGKYLRKKGYRREKKC